MKQFKNILYITEARVEQVSAVARAVSLAESNQAALTVMDVMPPLEEAYHASEMARRLAILESLVEPHRPRLKVQCRVATDSRMFLEVIQAVLRNDHDLVIKAAENPSFLKRIFGSDDMHLLRKCPCPVWIMKSPEKTTYQCIMAAVDFDLLNSSEEEQRFNHTILDLATSLAISDFAALHLVHVWGAFAEDVMRSRGANTHTGIARHVESEYQLHQKGLYRLAEALRDRIGPDTYDYLSPKMHFPKGSAHKMIAASAVKLKADLVVMGTVARTGISGLIIGNTAEAVLDQLNCSLLAVKPHGFVSPVRVPE